MKKKGLIIVIACVAIALVSVVVVLNPLGTGGVGNSTPNTEPPATENLGSSDTEGEVTNPGEEVIQPTFRISPGKFYLDDQHIKDGKGAYQAGESREYQLMVTNKNDHAANFSVDYRVPDNVVDGYSRPTSEVRDWVWISNRKPTIPAGETMAITIRLGMPSSATPPGDKWEFWIGVIDKSQTGWLVVELANRWLVTMK